MVQSKATTVEQYLAELPQERRETLNAVREVILQNLDRPNIEEGMQYGMIGYYVPHRVYPAGYHCNPKDPLPFAGLAAQKNHLSLYLMCVYGSEEQSSEFQQAWAKTGKRLDMGKTCIRFKKLDDLALDVIAKCLKRMTARKYILHYERSIKPQTHSNSNSGAPRTSEKKTAAEISKPAAPGPKSGSATKKPKGKPQK